MKINVLYEDNHLIAVYKPAGILVQGDKSGDISLMDEVKKYLKERYKKPGNVFLGLLHRLDRPVSGIVLFAKTSKGASRLSEQFRKHLVEKIYHAIVFGKPKQNRGALVNYIEKDKKTKKAIVKQNKKAKKAELYYEVVTSNKKYSLLKILIKTGRFHQIRAQLAAMGCPVLGDVKYGAAVCFPDKSIALCATSFSFCLATKQQIKKISIPFPSDWNNYLRFGKVT